MKWHTEKRKISELKNWDNNPRTISKKAYEELKESIEDLGNFEPLVVNTDGTVLAGNQRLKIHIEKGDTEVEVSVPERELSEEEVKKIGVISNRHSGEWDMDRLAEDFGDIISELGFTDLLPEEKQELYTAKIVAPIYEPGKEKPELNTLVDRSKVEIISDLIEKATIPEEEKEFLKIAATRFYTFNYSRIADYYSHSKKDTQKIMEKLALVIIDYDKAIEEGFLDFVAKVLNERKKDHND